MAISMVRKAQIRYLVKSCVKARDEKRELWDPTKGNGFDYPEYGGLPVEIADRLTGDCVDAIQNFIEENESVDFTAKQLEKYLIEQADRGYDLPY